MVLESVIRDERRVAGETDSHGRMAGKVKIRRGLASHMLIVELIKMKKRN